VNLVIRRVRNQRRRSVYIAWEMAHCRLAERMIRLQGWCRIRISKLSGCVPAAARRAPRPDEKYIRIPTLSNWSAAWPIEVSFQPAELAVPEGLSQNRKSEQLREIVTRAEAYAEHHPV
jgi:hypothetical protein